jgi:hypothetical protein
MSGDVEKGRKKSEVGWRYGTYLEGLFDWVFLTCCIQQAVNHADRDDENLDVGDVCRGGSEFDSVGVLIGFVTLEDEEEDDVENCDGDSDAQIVHFQYKS